MLLQAICHYLCMHLILHVLDSMCRINIWYGIAESKRLCTFNFPRYIQMSSSEALSVWIDTNSNIWEFLFPYILTKQGVIYDFYLCPIRKENVESWCSFNYHLSCFEWDWVSFCMFKSHIYTLFRRILIVIVFAFFFFSSVCWSFLIVLWELFMH